MHPFLEAAKRGDHASLNKYINGVGFDVDTLKDEDDNTGLNIACKHVFLLSSATLSPSHAESRYQGYLLGMHRSIAICRC